LIDDTDKENKHLTIENKLPQHIGVTRIFNKIDSSGRAPGRIDSESGTDIGLSAKTGLGIDLLKAHLKACMGYEQTNEGQFMARRRHITALENADQHLRIARYNLITLQAGELLAEELRCAQQQLSEITGEFTSDDLLGKIFSSFCIGK